MTYNTESVRIYKQLQQTLPALHGSISFQIGGIPINVKGKDGIGGLIEEWFGEWAKTNGFYVINPKETNSSQEFPDYYVGEERNMLEIKTFDSSASANFDIANFESYHESIIENPNRLDADYLIFSYLSHNGALSIKNVWLKKIWEITCPSERWPLKTQTKRDVIYNIRPAAWYSTQAQYHPFSSKEAFVSAVNKTMDLYNVTRGR